MSTLKAKEYKILYYMKSTELIANLFRISQTEEKLRKDKIKGAEASIKVHYSIGTEVKSAIKKIDGTMPKITCSGEKYLTNRKRTNETSKR